MENWKIVSIVLIGVAAISVSIVAVYSHMGTWRSIEWITTPAYGRCLGWHGGPAYYRTPPVTTEASISINEAVEIAQRYLDSLGYHDLAIREIEEYSLNYYVQYYERSTGIGAFETLIDKYTGSIYPEPGPNMMWNVKYGMHGSITGWYAMHGMMGGWYGVTPTADMPVTSEEAKNYAQQYLNAYIPGATVDEVEPFYGYYHVMVMLDGKPYGMLSVNGYTGQSWYHNWHGIFVQELELT